MSGSAQPENPSPTERRQDATAELHQSSSAVTGMPPANGGPALVEPELQAALQLLVERAQYITGATGIALALPQGEEMVCRASAGSSAPAVGARLQVASGLTGESISRKQLLRCDNAETDPRVNRETCRELGIASIVVLPMLTRSGETRGLFELFSDHAYAFEERDLVALERMADLTLTALSLAEKRLDSAVTPASIPKREGPVEPPVAEGASSGVALELPAQPEEAGTGLGTGEPPIVPAEETPTPAPSALPEATPAAIPPAPVPEAMRRVQKCVSCGFPVSEGRSLCVDCEAKRSRQPESAEAVPAEFVPAFLTSPPAEDSWLAAHVNLLAVLVLILSIVVAVVVFR
jgi:putative methionine-R-sulfoxide reductase with GAF domain